MLPCLNFTSVIFLEVVPSESNEGQKQLVLLEP